MAQAALFTVIGGTLVNLAKVTHIENAVTQPGHVIVHFDNERKAVLDGSVETTLLKIGGAPSDLSRKS